MAGTYKRYGIAAGAVLGIIALAGVVAMQLREQPPAAASNETPRTADGKPDLSGRWGGGGGGGRRPVLDEDGVLRIGGNYRKGNPTNGERDSGLEQRFGPNFPLYKPEHWERVDYLDNHGNVEDSAFHCMPAGVPRIGPPIKIMQTPTELVFMYQARNTWRVIPVDGRPHDPVNSNDQTFLGDSIGRWEGDTLVVDVVGFNETSWIGWPGYFHSGDMRVEERLRREGNTLIYQVTVHDPEVLQEPWVMPERRLNLNTSPRITYIEDPPCIETDSANLTTRERG
jgi:hypothetical protein